MLIEDKGVSVAVHARPLPYPSHEEAFARADILAVPWMAENTDWEFYWRPAPVVRGTIRPKPANASNVDDS
ncbi:MAG: hypothetical protein ACKOEC_14965 [Acidimicrobiia bacterium]